MLHKNMVIRNLCFVTLLYVSFTYCEEVPKWCLDRESELLEWIRDWQERNDLSEKEINMAWLNVKSETDQNLALYSITDECEKCDYAFTENIPSQSVVNLKLSSSYGQRLDVRFENSSSKCKSNHKLRESGIYWMVVNQTEQECCLLLENDPPNIYLPILFGFIILIGIAFLYWLVKFAIRKNVHKKILNNQGSHDLTANSSQNTLELASQTSVSDVIKIENEEEKQEEAVAPRKRLRSLDTFRGICLVVMIFVNYGAGGYTELGHVPWNGLALADLVFPWFVFIMGTAMAFAFRGMLKRGASRISMFIQVFRRTALLFAIGLGLNSWRTSPTKFEEFRIFGVMQRLALTYFLTALPEAAFTRQTLKEYEGTGRFFRDLLDSWPQWIINSCYLVLYLALTFGLPVPGCPRGYLGPGGLHDGSKFFNCSGGAAGYIDRVVLTNNHIYNWPTYRQIYKADLALDPEGILGTLCAAYMCFLGLQSGRIIQCYKSHSQRIIRWITWGVITGVIGTILCKASKNDGWIPINKNLWSLSFTLTLSSMAFFLLIILYIIIDVFNIWDGQPFYYPGMNSLIIYIGHSVFGQYIPINWYVPHDHWRLLLMDIWGASFWVIVAFMLYRKKIFIAL